MHRFNDLPWNTAHRDIQGPLQGLLRTHGRPAQKAAALTLSMLRQLLATCDRSARGRRDRALLLVGFAGALRRSELVALHVEDVATTAGREAHRSSTAASSTAELGKAPLARSPAKGQVMSSTSIPPIPGHHRLWRVRALDGSAPVAALPIVRP